MEPARSMALITSMASMVRRVMEKWPDKFEHRYK